jgi:hypothetical protein
VTDVENNTVPVATRCRLNSETWSRRNATVAIPRIQGWMAYLSNDNRWAKL